MIVLGIDPGIANTGYGVVERRCGRLFALDGGVITTRPEAPMQIRLAAIHRRVCELLDMHIATVISLEDIYFGKNASSAFAVGQARGVVMLAAGQRRLDVVSYTPQRGYAGPDQFTVTIEPNDHAVMVTVMVNPGQ